MRILPLLLLTALLTPVFAAEPNSLTDAEKAAGWKLLFDGKNPAEHFRGFKKETLPENWSAKDGALVYNGKGGGDIVTKEQYESFELSIDWKISKAGNSGIMFRVQESQGAPWVTGPEVQIQDNKDGGDPQKAGWMYALYPATTDEFTKPAGEWNELKLIVNGNKCEHWMNGHKIVEYEIGTDDWKERVKKSKFGTMPEFGIHPKGHICLQDHACEVAFRNIKIRLPK